MRKYQFEVTELVSQGKLYTVRAKSLAEAMEKAAIGDTIEESELTMGEVVSREVERRA